MVAFIQWLSRFQNKERLPLSLRQASAAQAVNEQGPPYELLATSTCSLLPLRTEAEGRELGEITGSFSPMLPSQENYPVYFKELFESEIKLCFSISCVQTYPEAKGLI